MKRSRGAGALFVGALLVGGCGGWPGPTTQGRARTTTAAFAPRASAPPLSLQGSERRRHGASPLVRACKSGNSKSCNELGDRLVLSHAYTEARQWYVTSCDRLRSAMLPEAKRLMQLNQELAQVEPGAAGEAKTAKLKRAAAEMKARIQGCFDTGETLRIDRELTQALTYYDTVCEFSTLVEVVGEAVPGFARLTQRGCAATQSARASLDGQAPFTPQLFVGLAEQQADESAPEGEVGMVFTLDDT